MPDMWLDVDAALTEVPVNKVALIDDTDFKTREESVVYNQAGLDLVWNFLTSAGVYTQTAVTPTTAGDYDWVNQGNGMYSIEIPASGGASINNDTEGYGWFTGFATGILPWTGPVIGFRAAALNNALVDGGDNLDVNLVQWLGTAAATPSVAGVPEIDVTHWNGTAVAAPTTAGVPEVELARISGQTVTAAAPVTINAEVGASATAMNAFEDQYDGTGLSGDTYPATQAQVSGISVGSAAQSVRVKAAPNGFVLTTGSEVNDEDSTVALDGVRHELTDSAGTLDCYYKFDISAGAVPVTATFKSVVNGGNDTFGIYVNIGSSSVPSWSQRLSITGTGTTTNDVYTADLYSTDVLTDLPTEVWLRVYGTGLTTSSFDNDQIFVSRSFNIQYSGYDNGAVWGNTVDGTAGTTLGYNGIASRPCLTLANLISVAAALGTHRFELSNNSSITFAESHTNEVWTGKGWTLALGGQDITNIHILDAKVSGIGTGSSVEFHDSPLTNVTLPGGSFHNCAIIGTFTCSAAATYHFHQSHSGDGTTPIIDLGAAVGNTVLLMHNWKGAIIIDNLGATGTDEINLAGDGEITLNASCVGGTLNIQGNWKLTNNGSGVTINYDDNTANIAAILVDTADMQPKLGTPAGADISADIAAVKNDSAAILVDTGTTLPALIDDLAIKKNTAYNNFPFEMVLTSDHVTPATGLTVTGQRSIDGGAFASVSGTITEISNGSYQFDALAADTNGDNIIWRFSAATADDTKVLFKTVA